MLTTLIAIIMLSIDKCRELVDDDEEYTDEQIIDIRKQLYDLAELAFDDWAKEKRDAKKKKQ